jgi:hypothetical protein
MAVATPDEIQRQYNEVIASGYDRDPQSVTGNTLDRAIEQIRNERLIEAIAGPVQAYDVGMGTGMFQTRLMALADGRIQPFGLDLSEKMIDCAYQKIPQLAAVVDTAENLDAHFPGQAFDLISTHFITGYVPLQVLAPKVWSRLAVGGYWSYLGATKGSFPTLQAKANSKLLRWLVGAPPLDLDKILSSPASGQEVQDILRQNGFEVCQSETFEPKVSFASLKDFLDFAYYGGWLTPFIEAIGLQNAGFFLRFMLNRFVFPMDDHHCIEIHLAQKVAN